MSRNVTLVRLRPTGHGLPPHRRSAFAVFAFALAVGTLVHEWNSTFTAWVVIPVVVAALAVLVRPASPVRLVLADGDSRRRMHRAAAGSGQPPGTPGGARRRAWALVARASGALTRRRARSRHNSTIESRPFSRLGFILMWFLAALAKLNGGVPGHGIDLRGVDPGIDPARRRPAGSWSRPSSRGTLAVETLTSDPPHVPPHPAVRTHGRVCRSTPSRPSPDTHGSRGSPGRSTPCSSRPRSWLAPRSSLARSCPRALRRAVDATSARPWPAVLLGAVAFIVGHYVLVPALGPFAGGARNWGAILVCLGWMGFTSVVLWRLRGSWFPGASRPRAGLAVRQVVLVIGLVVLVLNGMSPYLGLKTTAAFTMFSNLRTEPGHWNPLVRAGVGPGLQLVERRRCAFRPQ